MTTFHADQLFQRWGFGDGDLLDDLLWDNNLGEVHLDRDRCMQFAHEVLAAAVERWLLPALPEAVETYRICTIHNPIRAKALDYDQPCPTALQDVSVEVPDEDILKLARQLKSQLAI